MTEHDHRTVVEGCYRCELNADELDPGFDREPLPSDGPDYHQDHLAWLARQGADPYEYGRSDPESDRVEVWGELKYAQKWAAELGGTVLRRTRAVAAGEWEGAMSYVWVKISGVAYYAALDPAATGVPAQEGWPEPEYTRRVGKGLQFVYKLTREQAGSMAEHLQEIADSFAYGDPFTRAEGRACAQKAAYLRGLLA